MELILFNKYLVRGYEGGFILSKVKEGKEPIVIDSYRETKHNNGEITKTPCKDYSNFGKETYPSTFENVLKSIRMKEISDSDITTVEELKQLLLEIKNVEMQIQQKFE